MAFVALPFGIKVTIEWETGSGIAVCIHFVSKTSPVAVNTTDLNAACVWFDALGQALRPLQPANVVRSMVRAIDWSVPDGAQVSLIPFSTNNAGTNVSPGLPLNVAICATQVSGLVGRSRRGRNYIPGIAENIVGLGDVISPISRSTIANAYNTLRTNLLTAGLVQVVASFHANKLPRTVGQGTAVAMTTIDQFSDSQRRRLAGRGA